MGYLGKGPGIRTVLLIRHKSVGLSYVRTLFMSNPLRIYCARYLVDLLVLIIHRIGMRAERKAIKELVQDLERVDGKTTLLYKLATAALEQPNGIVKDVLFPVVGEPTLTAFVKEYRTQGPLYRRYVHTSLRRSYSYHYRRRLPLLLEGLTFRSNNAAHQ